MTTIMNLNGTTSKALVAALRKSPKSSSLLLNNALAPRIENSLNALNPCGFVLPAARHIFLCNFAESRARGGGGLRLQSSQRCESAPR